jgi:unsaturated chondroitin disaccharide hydrolase
VKTVATAVSAGTGPVDRPHEADAGERVLSIEEAFDFAQQQVRALITQRPGQTPTYTEQGRWVVSSDPWAPSWSAGFLAGLVWMIADRTQDPWWLDRARTYSRIVEPRKSDTGTHDIGFLMEPSWGRWYDLTGDPEARDVVIEAGRTMAGRFKEAGGYLRSWVAPGSTFIDIMMNVGIIFRAAEYSGDNSLREIAETHCLTSRRHLVRGDGSTIHEGWFDTESGEFMRADTHQGWRSDSSWARGTTWAIYGFTTAYEHTGNPAFLDSARRAADYYITMTPSNGIPPNDWLDPDPATRWEASAAAVASAAMLYLAEHVPTDPAAATYRDYGLRILRSLRSTTFIAVDTPGYEGIVKHATYHEKHGLGIDESVMWGDHYFVEALTRALRLTGSPAKQQEER